MVVRINKEGKIKNSRPCNHCLETMIKYKIKKIIYSQDDGSLIGEKPESMNKCHISAGWNFYKKSKTI